MTSAYLNLVFTRSVDGDHAAMQRWYNDHIGILWRCESLQRATLYRRDADVAHEADYICCYAFPDEAGFLRYEHGDAREAARLWAGQAVPPLFSSFKPDALAGARATAPHIPRALLLDTLWDGWAEVADQLGCVAIVCNHALWDAALVTQVHAASMRALSYTVNDDWAAQRLIELGTDGIITDRVDLFSPAG